MRHAVPALVACLLSIPTIGVTAATAFSNSAATTDLTLNGSAKILTGPNGGSVLWLTPAGGSSPGSAFTTNSIVFNARYAFKTFFQFKMTDPGGIGAADGITFVLQTESASALGAGGGNLGYLGIAPSVGVEFDTFYNPGIDINNNTIAILMNGEMSDLDPQTPYGVTKCNNPTGVHGCMSNGDIWSVWIDYDGSNLNVAIADNSTTRPANLLSYPIDIPSLLGQKPAFVGFTAATGAGWENHYIVDWQFMPAPAASQEQ
jgi:hypothetical protein